MDAGSSSAHAAGPTRDRPTLAEEQEALSVIDEMRKTDPPLVTRMGQPPKPNVVACALALSRKEQFKRGDAEAKERFGVGPKTDVRGVWVEGKLATLAPAGFAPVPVGGAPLPTFLLDRRSAAGRHVPSYIDLDALRARYKPDVEEEGEEEGELQGHDGWMLDNLREMARREREWVEWACEHVDEREAQHTVLAEAEPLYFWALEYAINQKPKWVLRKGEWLEADSARTLGENELRVDEPLPLYRAFEPFVGDASAAAARFGNPYLRANKNWEKRGRAALEAELAARGAAHLCTGNCPPPSDDEETVESGEEASEPEESADCFYEGAATHERLAQADRVGRANGRAEPRVDYHNDYEQDRERALHDDARRFVFYEKPVSAYLQPGLAAPDGWSEADVLHAREVERQEHRRLERAAREGFPPPHRSDARYGPQVQNPVGDDCFRDDRREWYEQVTGVSLTGAPLSEQWRLCDTLARRYRQYTDSRAARVVTGSK